MRQQRLHNPAALDVKRSRDVTVDFVSSLASRCVKLEAAAQHNGEPVRVEDRLAAHGIGRERTIHQRFDRVRQDIRLHFTYLVFIQDEVLRYLELQNEWPFFNRKSSFFRGNSPFFLHFQ